MWPGKWRNVSFAMGIVLIFLGVIWLEKLYTGVTFVSLGILLVLLRQASWMKRFILSYLVLLVPFFVVNGILTGTGIQEEVVFYNDHENLGLRLFTIPVEDIFYGMLLILLNVAGFEWLRSKSLDGAGESIGK